MTEHNYSIFAKFIYKYSIFPMILLLLFYFVASVFSITQNWIFIFPTIINAIIIYLLIKYFLNNYRTMPFRIKADNEMVEVSKFAGNRKSIKFRMSQIIEIKGGIFDGSQSKPVKLYIEDEDSPITFNLHISDHNTLFTKILSNINQELYSDLVKRIGERNKKFAELIKSKKSGKKKARKNGLKM